MLLREDGFPRPVCIFAHPDDEILAMGGALQTMRPSDLVIVTDGAPPWISDPVAHAAMRRAESRAAIALCGIPHQLHFLGFPDQGVAATAREVVRALLPFLAGGSEVFTHALEHGHPDHDAVCVATHIAAQIKKKHKSLTECSLYRSKDGELAFSASDQDGIVLSDDVREHKRRMLNCFLSQQDFLNRFPLEKEVFHSVPLRISVALETLLEDFPVGIPSTVSADEWRHLGALLEASAP